VLKAGHRVPVSIAQRDGHIVVTSPYDSRSPLKARDLGGEWDAVRRVWVFDAREDERVRALCRQIYGTDGTKPFPDPSAVGGKSRQFAEAMPARPHYFGHRQRLRERLMAAGPESLPDYELLEMLLFAAYRRGDVKPLAKDLLAQFGGFGEVMSADPDALAQAGLNLPALRQSNPCARPRCG
jgi:DNA repair protein RadC